MTEHLIEPEIGSFTFTDQLIDGELRWITFYADKPMIRPMRWLHRKLEELFGIPYPQIVIGFWEDAAEVWRLIDAEGVKPPQGPEVVLNAQAAAALNAKVGEDVTLWIELPSAVPRDTLLGRKDNDSQEVTLKVSAITAAGSSLSRLGLNPTQALPLNAFVDLHVLQDRLDLAAVPPSRRDPVGKPGRINALFASGLELWEVEQLVPGDHDGVPLVVKSQVRGKIPVVAADNRRQVKVWHVQVPYFPCPW